MENLKGELESKVPLGFRNKSGYLLRLTLQFPMELLTKNADNSRLSEYFRDLGLMKNQRGNRKVEYLLGFLSDLSD